MGQIPPVLLEDRQKAVIVVLIAPLQLGLGGNETHLGLQVALQPAPPALDQTGIIENR